ncbi:hypothetical protein KIV64_gp41 [Mycobacterium phage DroogsArmy]|uniref:Uncharacterized protein n=1 Tax=Mycobacterium phage DroogsArmy TaxID=2744011 RepID=A0A6N0A786_9CAUD|nr:hypothetical protein KIV64_gp41 [Mycobacterium phage DroogsArmy]QKO02447.1 hypothetical protein SEA_DROOGSARMY_51 [Mycobacterium phage DroogsArmy]
MNDLVKGLVQGRLDMVTAQIGYQREVFTKAKQDAHKADQTLGELIKEKQALVAALGLVPGPRVWQSFDEIPHDVDVYDAGGHRWSFWGPDRLDRWGQTLTVAPGEWLWSYNGSKPTRSKLRHAPFTEVTE